MMIFFVDDPSTGDLTHLQASTRPAPSRTTTFVGPGGIGKTRLVLKLLDTLDISPVFLAELAEVPAGADPTSLSGTHTLIVTRY